MANVTTVHVAGLRELGEKMRALSRKVNLKISGAATGAAARMVKAEAVRNLVRSPSIATGSLRDAVIAKKLPKSQTRLTSEHIVTVRGRGKKTKRQSKTKQTIAPHAHFVEFGTVNMAAEPFLAPAFDSQKQKAVQKIKDTLTRGIAREAGKR